MHCVPYIRDSFHKQQINKTINALFRWQVHFYAQHMSAMCNNATKYETGKNLIVTLCCLRLILYKQCDEWKRKYDFGRQLACSK